MSLVRLDSEERQEASWREIGRGIDKWPRAGLEPGYPWAFRPIRDTGMLLGGHSYFLDWLNWLVIQSYWIWFHYLYKWNINNQLWVSHQQFPIKLIKPQNTVQLSFGCLLGSSVIKYMNNGPYISLIIFSYYMSIWLYDIHVFRIFLKLMFSCVGRTNCIL